MKGRRRRERELDVSIERKKSGGTALLNLSQFKNCYYLFFVFIDNNVRINEENNNMKIFIWFCFSFSRINNQPIGMYHSGWHKWEIVSLKMKKEVEEKQKKTTTYFSIIMLCQKCDVPWYGFSLFSLIWKERRWYNFKSDTSN